MVVEFSLGIHDGVTIGYSSRRSENWQKVIEMPAIPHVGESLLINGQWSVDVKRRWWADDGSVAIELVDICVDPPETFRPSSGYRTGWSTELNESDPRDALRVSGWKRR